MAIRWRPAHIVILHKFCDVKGCGLEMQEQEDQRPPIDFSNKVRLYQYRCPNGHVDSDRGLYPQWSVRAGVDPAIKKDKCKCQS